MSNNAHMEPIASLEGLPCETPCSSSTISTATTSRRTTMLSRRRGDVEEATTTNGIVVELDRAASKSTAHEILPYSSALGHHDTWSYKGEGEQDDVSVSAPRRQREWRGIANFHFGWFGAALSTGMIGLLLTNLPYQFRGLHYIVIVVFVLTLALFVLFSLVSIVRYAIWPTKFVELLHHPSLSLTTAMVPMAMGTIVDMIVQICVPAWGGWVLVVAWTLWWIHAVISVLVCFYIPWLHFTVHDITLDKITAAWLLPPVAAISSSSAGAVIAGSFPNPNHALITLVTSYVIWGFSVPLGFIVIAVYFQRLIFHKIVPDIALASSIVPIGPLGQAAYGIMKLGAVTRGIFPELNILQPIGGEMFYVAGMFTGLIIWGFALLWLWFALASFATRKMKFSLGWWALVFPSAAFVLATAQLGKEFDFLVFRILATIFTCVVVIVWVMVFSVTTWKTITKEIFSL